MPYYALARGLPDRQVPAGRRGRRLAACRASQARYLDDRGTGVLAASTRSPPRNATTVAAVALAWLAAQPTVVAPIASARTTEQLADLLPMAGLQLTAEELRLLTESSEQ